MGADPPYVLLCLEDAASISTLRRHTSAASVLQHQMTLNGSWGPKGKKTGTTRAEKIALLTRMGGLLGIPTAEVSWPPQTKFQQTRKRALWPTIRGSGRGHT